MYASVYSEMKPHPTRCAPGEEGSGAASVGVGYFNPCRAVPGRTAALANRTTREDMPPRLGCALNATEVQSSRRISISFTRR